MPNEPTSLPPPLLAKLVSNYACIQRSFGQRCALTQVEHYRDYDGPPKPPLFLDVFITWFLGGQHLYISWVLGAHDNIL